MTREQSYTDFIREVSKRTSKRKAKVTNSFGVYDVYKWIRKNHWYNIGRKVTEKEFYAIIRGINKIYAQDIANGSGMVFPSNMGKLELQKYEVGVSLVDGKLKNKYPIDWSETLKLWYEDEEARKKKILLRDEQKYVFRVKYNKTNATYENKFFYRFALNIYIKKALKENIKQDKLETLW